MKYHEIKKVLMDNKLYLIDTDIVIAVYFAEPYPLTDEEFDLICKYVSSCMDDVNVGYTQLMADIVVDMYCDCEYGYRTEDEYLTIEDLQNPYNEKRDMVLDRFCQAY